MSERDFDLASLRADQERDAGVARVRAAVRGQFASVEVTGPLLCDCGAEISPARRAAYPNTTKCIDCATFEERQRRRFA
jgi:RNA polymerase-binding transcription factor DksA